MSEERQNSPLIRPLEPGEWGVLARAFAQTRTDEPPPRPEHSLAQVAEARGGVVGAITAERVYCVSNFYLEREYRGGGLAGELARAIAARNAEGLSEMLITTSRHVELVAFNLGFTPLAGTLWRR